MNVKDNYAKDQFNSRSLFSFSLSFFVDLFDFFSFFLSIGRDPNSVYCFLFIFRGLFLTL